MYIYMYSRGHWTSPSWCIYKTEGRLQVAWFVLSRIKNFSPRSTYQIHTWNAAWFVQCSTGNGEAKVFLHIMFWTKHFFTQVVGLLAMVCNQGEMRLPCSGLCWIHHFLRFMGNSDGRDTDSRDSEFQSSKLENTPTFGRISRKNNMSLKNLWQYGSWKQYTL